MKRNTATNTKTTHRTTRTIDARRLTAVRGGSGLGITFDLVDPPLPIMQQQHNEILVATRHRRA